MLEHDDAAAHRTFRPLEVVWRVWLWIAHGWRELLFFSFLAGVTYHLTLADDLPWLTGVLRGTDDRPRRLDWLYAVCDWIDLGLGVLLHSLGYAFVAGWVLATRGPRLVRLTRGVVAALACWRQLLLLGLGAWLLEGWFAAWVWILDHTGETIDWSRLWRDLMTQRPHGAFAATAFDSRGLWLGIAWRTILLAFVLPVVSILVDRRCSVIEALTASFALTRGAHAGVFALVLGAQLIVATPALVLFGAMAAGAPDWIALFAIPWAAWAFCSGWLLLLLPAVTYDVLAGRPGPPPPPISATPQASAWRGPRLAIALPGTMRRDAALIVGLALLAVLPCRLVPVWADEIGYSELQLLATLGGVVFLCLLAVHSASGCARDPMLHARRDVKQHWPSLVGALALLFMLTSLQLWSAAISVLSHSLWPWTGIVLDVLGAVLLAPLVFVVPAITVERRRLPQAIYRSLALTRGHRLRIAIVLAALVAVETAARVLLVGDVFATNLARSPLRHGAMVIASAAIVAFGCMQVASWWQETRSSNHLTAV